MTGTPPNPLSDTGSLKLPRSQYGAIWRRFVACVIDYAIVGTCLAPVLVLLIWAADTTNKEVIKNLAGTAVVIGSIIADWLYNAKMTSSSRQATYGKQFMGLKVTGMKGEQISFGQATGRYFAKFLSTFAAFVGFFIAAFTRRKQALHDIVALTVVVRA